MHFSIYTRKFENGFSRKLDAVTLATPESPSDPSNRSACGTGCSGKPPCHPRAPCTNAPLRTVSCLLHSRPAAADSSSSSFSSEPDTYSPGGNADTSAESVSSHLFRRRTFGRPIRPSSLRSELWHPPSLHATDRFHPRSQISALHPSIAAANAPAPQPCDIGRPPARDDRRRA